MKTPIDMYYQIDGESYATENYPLTKKKVHVMDCMTAFEKGLGVLDAEPDLFIVKCSENKRCYMVLEPVNPPRLSREILCICYEAAQAHKIAEALNHGIRGHQ